MRVERALLEELSEKVFNIGYQGELNHTQVIISCPVMFRDYPDAVASMVVKPPQGDLYPVSLTRDGNDLTWDVSASDVAIPGAGILQLTFTDGEGEEAEIIKTVYGNYSVNASLVANGDAPDPVQSWLDEAGAALATFENEIGDIRKITTATEEDEGLALSPKTVVNGKVTEWEYIDLADPEVVTQAIDDWLDDHPEATTTVEDGAITEAKLNDSLKADLAWQDDVDDVKNALSQSKAPVILDTASGEIVTVPDGADGMLVEQMVVGIDPVQDLHGQSNPYPAGGGKNLFDIDGYLTDRSASYTKSGDTYTITASTSLFTDQYVFSDTDEQVTISFGSFENGTTTNVRIDVINTNGTIVNNVYPGTGTITVTANKMRFNWSTPGNFTISKLQIERGSTATPYAPYSNLCPISGYSAAEVVRTGKNLVDKSQVAQGTISSSGTNQNSDYRIRTDYTLVKGGESYYMSFDPVAVKADYVFFYDKNKTLLSYIGTSSTYTFTTPDDCKYIRFTMYNNQTGALSPSGLNAVQLELGTSGTAFEAYHATQTKTYTFPTPPGTVYGGTLTVNQDGTGTLVVDRAEVDLGSLTWAINTQYANPVFLGFIDNAKIPAASSQYADAICSMYRQLSRSESNVPGINDVFAIGPYYSGTYNVNIIDKAYSDTTTFKTAVTGQTLVYELETPVVYNLTNLEVIELLKGTNNVWANCGNVSIEYPCDTKLYIEQLTAPTEDDMIANANIASGRFFMVGNNLYISTSAIAQGETITPGTNCTAVSLADALNAINQ